MDAKNYWLNGWLSEHKGLLLGLKDEEVNRLSQQWHILSIHYKTLLSLKIKE